MGAAGGLLEMLLLVEMLHFPPGHPRMSGWRAVRAAGRQINLGVSIIHSEYLSEPIHQMFTKKAYI